MYTAVSAEGQGTIVASQLKNTFPVSCGIELGGDLRIVHQVLGSDHSTGSHIQGDCAKTKSVSEAAKNVWGAVEV